MKRRSLFVLTSIILIAMPLFAKISPTPLSQQVLPHLALHSLPRRVISLSPSLTEIMYAIGAGQSLIAVDTASDFPLEVNHLPKVAQYPSINIESLLLLKPDLVIAEDSTHMRAQLNQLKAMGISVYIVHVRTIDDIPNLLIAIGRITHSEKQALESATRFKQRYDALKRTYQHRPPVSVFYELWPHPLLTVTHKTLINQVIEDCGGRNSFADAKGEAPNVSTERVLKGRPQVILMSPASNAEAQRWQEEWQGWKDWLPAVSQYHIYAISPDKLTRFSPRLLDATTEVCKDLDFARNSTHPEV